MILVTASHAGKYLHTGVFNLSYTNLEIIGVMVLLFVLALVLPFHGGRR